MTVAETTLVIPRAAARLGPLAAALAAALLAAGCAHRAVPLAPQPAPVAVPGPLPGPPPIVAGKPAPLPPVPSEDETLPGLRYGATRAELLAAYPGADCGTDHC